MLDSTAADHEDSHAPEAASQVRVAAIALGSALATALTTAFVEFVLTLRHTHATVPGDRGALLVLLLSLYDLVALPLALAETAVIAGLAASGAIESALRFLRRLAREERFDRKVASFSIASAVAGMGFVYWVSRLSIVLVAQSKRQLVGSILCGVVVTASIPLFVVLAVSLRRLTMPIARILPRGSRVSATAILAITVAAAAALALGLFVEAKLDWRGMRLGPLVGGALFFALQGVWLVLLVGPLARVRWLARVWRPALGAALVAAVALPISELRSEPRPGALMLLFQASYGGASLVRVVQRFFDRDHDGFSTVLGGGDCNDHDPSVHPGARDIPDDGIDQNCLGGDAHATPPPPPPAPVPGGFAFQGNVVFVFIDTLRADRLDARRMPNLDALARRGARFTRAYAQAPGTSRSYPSLLTSRLPSRIAWEDPLSDYPVMLSQNETIFEALHAAGNYTAAIASHYYFDTQGLALGFDELDNTGAPPPDVGWLDVSSPRILARVDAFLARRAAKDRRFALMIHLPEPHAAYLPHPEVRNGGPAPVTQEGRYDEEVTYLDTQLARLFEMLAARGLADRTMLVIFADHGEAFGTHHDEGQDISYHGQTLHDEVLRVPLVISAPGLAPRVVEQPVMLMDVAPTVLDVLGVPLPQAFQGRSLSGALAGLPLAPAPIHAELLPRQGWKLDGRALIAADGRTKVIYNITHPRFEVFDLERDPDEQHDISQLEPDVTARMRLEMAAWLDATP